MFRRTALAQQMARQLLQPSLLDAGLRSGLFLSGLRRTGKTTFLRQDLIPALEALGALVIYVDLWSDTHIDPGTLIHAALRKALADLQVPGSGLLARLRRVKGVDLGGAGFKFAFQLTELGVAGGPTIAQAVREVVDQSRTDVVLIVDEVQQMLASDDNGRLMLAIKSARDEVNTRPDTPGHFIFIGTGSHRAQVVGMTLQGKNAFEGATPVDYPTLGKDYVAYVLSGLAREGIPVLPGLEAADAAFDTLGRRPEEFMRALRQLQNHQPQDADLFLPVIAATLKGAAADVELRKIEDLGTLATVVFDRIAQASGDASRLFSADALAAYSAAVGREITADQVQRVAEELRNANVIIRKGHGLYAVTDPFVQQAWRDHKTRQARPLSP